MILSSTQKKIRNQALELMSRSFAIAIPLMDKEDFEDLVEELEEVFDRYHSKEDQS